MIAQFKQDIYNKIFSLQDQGECDENDTLQKQIKLYNEPERNHYFCGVERDPEFGEFKKNLDKWVRNQLKVLKMKFNRKHPKRVILQTNQTFIILMTFGV